MRKRHVLALLALLPGLAWGQAPAVKPPPISLLPQVATSPAQPEPHPAIWLLEDADTRIYLFGTFHILDPQLRWRSPAINQIVRTADELALEVSDRELTARGPNPFAMMIMGKSVPLRERVSPDRRDALGRMLRALQVPENIFDSLETWAVGMLLGMAQLAGTQGGGGGDAAFTGSASAGVEIVLIREFRANQRPIVGAETSAGILGAFRAMPTNEQQAMLEEAIDGWGTAHAPHIPDQAAWATGNIESLAAAMSALPPRLHEMLITRRNRGFADWAARRLEQPGTVLFAIGAGHLAGPDSVVAMLESRGLRVQRVH